MERLKRKIDNLEIEKKVFIDDKNKEENKND